MQIYLKMLVTLILLFNSSLIQAHTKSVSYITLSEEDGQWQGKWKVNLVDLNFTYSLDADHNGELTWGEFKTGVAPLLVYPDFHFSASGRRCSLVLREPALQRARNGIWAEFLFEIYCPEQASPTKLNYLFLKGAGANHVGIVNWKDKVNVVSHDQTSAIMK